MRDKLIELVDNVLKCLPWGEVSAHTAEDVANYLIANEVTINPMPKPKPITNADRIRAMSDEELAEWLVSKTIYQESAFCSPSYLNFLTGFDDTKEIAIEGTVKWLKQPASDEER